MLIRNLESTEKIYGTVTANGDASTIPDATKRYGVLSNIPLFATTPT